jgi:hypothetical protein
MPVFDPVEEVTGVICWDPEKGPVGPGPHAPRPDLYRVYEGQDGKLKTAPIQRTDDGKERYEWDDAEQAYKMAKEGEKKSPRSDRPKIKFDKIAAEELDKIMKLYGL